MCFVFWGCEIIFSRTLAVEILLGLRLVGFSQNSFMPVFVRITEDGPIVYRIPRVCWWVIKNPTHQCFVVWDL